MRANISARLLRALLACIACTQAFFASAAETQKYPTRPVRLIVPWPPGGGVDIAARAIQPKLAEHLGQPVVIDNRAGASGQIGTQLAARSPADGYTILLGAAGPNAILPLLTPKPPYDALEDFAEVSHFVNTLYVLVANPAMPASSVGELVALTKARSAKLTVGVTGIASPAHIAGEFLRVRSGVALVSVFYKGVAGAVTEVIGGQIDTAMVTISPVIPHAKTGKLKVLGVTSGERSTQLPDVPTFAESGFPGFEVVNWYGVLAPAGTPRSVIARTATDMTKTVGSPEVKERLIAAGLEIVESTPAQFAAFRKADLAGWARMIREGNIRLD